MARMSADSFIWVMVMDVGRGNLERVAEGVGVEEGECPLLLWSARASNFC